MTGRDSEIETKTECSSVGREDREDREVRSRVQPSNDGRRRPMLLGMRGLVKAEQGLSVAGEGLVKVHHGRWGSLRRIRDAA